MNNLPSITIAICTYNRAGYLEDTLQDISRQTAAPETYEVLVVNNNSTDNTRQICSRFSSAETGLNFSMIDEPRQGLSFARNRAAREAASNTVLYIDDDVHLPDRFIETALQYLENEPAVQCAGGRIFVSFDDREPDWIPDELMPMFGLHDLGEKDRIYPASNFPRGGNMLIKKKLFDDYGYFDTDLGRIGNSLMGSEEKAFFEHIRENGIEPRYWANLQLDHRIGSGRLQSGYLKKQSMGIGASERLRLKSSAVKTALKLGSELFKFAGSLLLSLVYLAQGKIRAGRFIITFRIWVLKGFLKKQGAD